MVINSPCLNSKKELAIPEQMDTGKESTNPFMADSLPKTIMPTKLVKPQGFSLRPNMGMFGFFCGTCSSCKELPGFKYRHDIVRDILFDICRCVGISVKKEALVNFLTKPSDGRSTLRPTDVIVFRWVGGKHVCMDLTEMCSCRVYEIAVMKLTPLDRRYLLSLLELLIKAVSNKVRTNMLWHSPGRLVGLSLGSGEDRQVDGSFNLKKILLDRISSISVGIF
ncbi:hypothetical protein Tco_0585526 [Tanacetum coccineum]